MYCSVHFYTFHPADLTLTHQYFYSFLRSSLLFIGSFVLFFPLLHFSTSYLISSMVERCLRCVPHDEDTGGFFVATLRKIEKPSSVSTTTERSLYINFSLLYFFITVILYIRMILFIFIMFYSHTTILFSIKYFSSSLYFNISHRMSNNNCNIDIKYNCCYYLNIFQNLNNYSFLIYFNFLR